MALSLVLDGTLAAYLTLLIVCTCVVGYKRSRRSLDETVGKNQSEIRRDFLSVEAPKFGEIKDQENTEREIR